MSLSALCCKRMHYCHKGILSQFPPVLLHPVNSLCSCSPVFGACDSVIILLSEGRSRQLGCSALSSNGCLFNTALFSPTHSNHHLKNHLHYIHSVLHCWTNQCTSDSQRLCECAGILRNQWHPGASERIRGFPRGGTPGHRGPLFSWLSSSTPISHLKYRAASSKSSMPECRVESPIQSYIAVCTDRWKTIIKSVSPWGVMGSHNAGAIPSAAAEAQAVPGAGCSCENPTDVAWCLTLGGIVAICSAMMLSQTVCKSSPVPQKCWRLKKAGGVKALKGWDRFQEESRVGKHASIPPHEWSQRILDVGLVLLTNNIFTLRG